MKKFIATLLVLLFAISFAACSQEGSGTPTAAPTATATPADAGGTDSTPTATAASTPKPTAAEPTPTIDNAAVQQEGLIGWFDPNFDYTAYPQYKIALIASSNDFLTLEFDRAFQDWAVRMNMNYTGLWFGTAGNDDEYLSGLQSYCQQDYDGLIIQPNLNIYSRIKEILDEANMQWSGGIGQARSDNGIGPLIHPTVGFINVEVGYKLMQYCLEWKEANYPDVPWEKVGVIQIDMGVSDEIMIRSQGSEIWWAQEHPEMGEYNVDREINPKNYWLLDVMMGTGDQVTAMNMTTQVMSANPDIEVWLVPACVDFYAMGAAQAAENLGLTDRTEIVCNGGSQLPLQYDAGIENAWRSALYTAQPIYGEPMIAMLWAFMSGLATPETIYPEWVKWDDKGDIKDASGNVIEEHNYANVLIPAFWITKDNYKSYLEWVDLYAYGAESDGLYNYEKVTDLNLFPARAEVPDNYKKP